jgi:hypothetical protein
MREQVGTSGGDAVGGRVDADHRIAARRSSRPSSIAGGDAAPGRRSGGWAAGAPPERAGQADGVAEAR